MFPLTIKDTDELPQELMNTPDLERFLQENEDHFRSSNITDALNSLLQSKQLSRAELANRSCTSEVYFYQLFSGRRFPSRNRLLCICFGAAATLEETQCILRQCGFATLYAANRRDAIIIHSLLHSQDLYQVNDVLFTENEETLY